MTVGPVRNTSPLVAVEAEQLRAALALAVFAAPNTYGDIVVRYVRLTVADRAVWAQASDRYVAALYRGPAEPGSSSLDVLLHRDDALKLAKTLRTATGLATLSADRPGLLNLTAENRKRDMLVGVVRYDDADEKIDGTPFPPLAWLIGQEREPAGHGIPLDPAKVAQLAEWQKLAAGAYAPSLGAVWTPVQQYGKPMLRVVASQGYDAETPRGLVAVIMGVIMPTGHAQHADDAAAAILDGAPAAKR